MASFRALLAEGQDEQVSVNQRALVEKILARYSGEHTVFRELLQNSDDAGASTVELHFRTSPSDGVGSSPSISAQPAHSPDALPDLLTTKVSTVLVRNDGFVFRPQDWARLTEIASGNPDETKIGAFGVGFYSLFSLCDEPVVSSGNKVLGFYWKGGGDQLYVKSASDEEGLKNVSPEGKPWSSFLMELREQQAMPEPNDFARFLASCLGFTSNLRQISLYFDSHLIFRITKTLAPSRPIPLKPQLASVSPLKILRLKSVEEAPFQLKAEVSHWVLRSAVKPKPAVAQLAASAVSSSTSFATRMLSAFSSSHKPSSSSSSSVPSPAPSPSPASGKPAAKDPLSHLTVTLFLRTVASALSVSPSSHFQAEMLRSTKKPLPATTKYSLIWTGKDEFDASHRLSDVAGGAAEDDVESRRVFSGLLSSDLEQQGRVAVGFLTFQTTGCAASVGARFISTVERESLDFQAKYVSDWNRELLWAGGVTARTVYEEEMEEIGREWERKKRNKGKVEEEVRKRLEERVLHLLKFFTFSKSTPQDIVSALTESTFFTSTSSTSVTLLSNLGPTPSHKLRLPSPQLAGFIKSIPTVPSTLADGAPRFLAVLRDKGLVRDISLEDVFADLAQNALTIPEAVECFKWWSTLASSRAYDHRLLQRLKDGALLSVPDSSSSSSIGGAENVSIRPLSSFTTFLNPKTVPLDVPHPPHTLPFELSRHFSHSDLSRVFGFNELSLLEWTRFLISGEMAGQEAKGETNVLKSAVFAEKVLAVLAKGWHGTPATSQQHLITLLSTVPFIPTRLGPKSPSESYFPNVALFDDLAVVVLPSSPSSPSSAPTTIKGNLEKLLRALGVRSHVELQLVFTRLLGAGDWSHVQLLRYLVSVKDTLSPSERDRLKKTAFLPKEGEAKVEQPVGAEGMRPKARTVRYRAGELYEPTEALRELGLPVVDWTDAGAKWRAGSEEAKLLFDLGLLRQPPVDVVLMIAADATDEKGREKALRYFLDGCVTMGYSAAYSPSKHSFAFVPAMHKGNPLLAKPSEVYGNPEAALLGFPILLSKYAAEEGRFQLRKDPLPQDLVASVVAEPPKTVEDASKVFAYLSSQVSHFSSSDIEALRWASFIPVRRPSAIKYEPLPPVGLYFSTSDTSLPSGLKSLFMTVPDFGPAAKPFLVAVGVKDSPSTAEIAQMLINEPSKFFDLAGSAERYLSVLRLVAVNYPSFPSTLRSRMKLSSFFLGTKRISSGTTSSSAKKTLLDEDSDDDDEGGESTLVYQLARASELAINDEPAAFAVFQGDILSCPQEDALEALAEQLGANRISKLISEHYRTTGEPDVSKRAQELKRTVGERTFLFLSERRQQYGKGELKHSEPEWIQTHLSVFEVRSIELVRTLNSPQGLKKNSSAASACVKAASNGSVELYVSQSIEVDYYEVAVGLCKILLSKVRPNDALLLLTILQTTLKNLKRRGFQVDRLLNARKAEREAAEQRLREERLREQLRKSQALSSDKLDAYTEELAGMFPDAAPAFLRTLLETQEPPQLENAANQLLSTPHYPKRRDKQPPGALPPSSSQQSISAQGQQQGGGGLFSSLRRQFARPEPRMPSPLPPPPSLTPPSNTPPTGVAQRPPGMSPTPHRPGATPTSTEAIRANLTRAIQASRPETASNVSNAVEQTQVKESDAYCDSTAAADLAFVADVGGVRFFAARDVPDPTTFVATHHDALLRFVTQVILPVGKVFNLDPRALHVFHDLEGPLIAFNRNRSIYLNFRFYLAWHDKMVVDGHLEEPLISTYHSVAHELSHNLVKPHDTQFSFYFSSFCEEYFLPMARLLQSVQQVA
ncbi:hypothetical protein JCM8547_009340 [Rhodosporidiobolus lusitaniae]